jgi:YidC/Oxa1 family membrane protein insertase
MSNLPVPDMTNGGWLWFQDLTVGDPYYILPFASSAVVYYTIKRGGETGADQAAMAEGIKKVMGTVLPGVMLLISAFQPAGIQLYLGFTSVLSAITATMLRNPTFRNATGLTPLPTPESQEMWKKVIRKEIPMNKVLNPDGTIKAFEPKDLGPVYQAPGKTGTQLRGINVASKAALPLHLRQQSAADARLKDPALQDRDHDYDKPPSGIMDKVDWLGRNYNPRYVWRRMKGYVGEMAKSPMVQSELEKYTEKAKKKVAQRKKEEWEQKRRERFNR